MTNPTGRNSLTTPSTSTGRSNSLNTPGTPNGRCHSIPNGRSRTTSRASSREHRSQSGSRLIASAAGDHYVTFTATFAIAFKRDNRDHVLFNESVKKVQEANAKTQEAASNGFVGRQKQGMSMEAPKPKHYFHSEFQLLQDGQRFDTDVVTYGVACKLFREGETKLLRTFEDESANKTWFIYRTHHQIKITDKSLDSIYNNPVKIRLWESKERCIPRARFERPKAFRFQEACASTPEHGYTLGINDYDFPHSIPQQSVNPAFAEQVNYICSSPVYEQRVGKFSGVKPSKTPISNFGAEHAGMTKEQARVANRRRKLAQESNHNSQESVAAVKSTRPNSASKLPHIQAECDLSVLFAGFKAVTSRGKLNPAAVSLGSGVRDMFVTFSIDRDLLTEKQKETVNPLVFRIKSISNLPDTPIAKKVLEQRCKPVYCSYSFCGNRHTTHEKNHGTHRKIIFDDVKVFLVGHMNLNKIIEEFQVKPLEFELHDRDQKTGADMIGTKNDANRPMLFGEDPHDVNFGKKHAIGTRGSARSRSSTFLDPSKSDAHGVARLNLKGLLDGSTTYIAATIPIVPASVKSSAGIPCGHYLQADTEMHVEVSLAKPLVNQENTLSQQKVARPYQLIAFIFDNNHLEACLFIQNLKKFVAEHNQSHFKMHDLSTIMTTYQMDEHRDDYNSNQWVSGFHLFDGRQHAILLEASWDVIEKSVAERFIPETYNGTSRICDVLHDSSLLFSERQFAHNPILYATKLHKPMAQILSNPKMYIEEHKELVQAVLAFWNLRTCRTIREAMKTKSLPSRVQLLALEKTLGVPVYTNANSVCAKTNQADADSGEGVGVGDSGDLPDVPEEYQRKHRCLTPLDHANPEFIKARSSHPTKAAIIKKNIRTVTNMSEIVKHQNDERMQSDRPYTAAFDDSVIKHYLAQQRNQERCKTMARLHDVYRRPSKQDEVHEASKAKRSRRPRFTPFGHKTAVESNRHVQKPSEDRCQELHTPWVENTLHAATLEPTLPERDQDPVEDMKLYFGKMDLFDPTTPVSIILGGDRKTEEINTVKERDQRIWKEKLVADPQWKFCRQNSGTEQKIKLGPQFGLDKLKGILKDEPVLENLKRFPVHGIPALPVFDK